MSQLFREKNKLKLLTFEKYSDFILKSTIRKRPTNSGKVAEFKKKFEIAECFRKIAVNFCSTGGRASSGTGNTGREKEKRGRGHGCSIIKLQNEYLAALLLKYGVIKKSFSHHLEFLGAL
jgi:hypothetical protein